MRFGLFQRRGILCASQLIFFNGDHRSLGWGDLCIHSSRLLRLRIQLSLWLGVKLQILFFHIVKVWLFIRLLFTCTGIRIRENFWWNLWRARIHNLWIVAIRIFEKDNRRSIILIIEFEFGSPNWFCLRMVGILLVCMEIYLSNHPLTQFINVYIHFVALSWTVKSINPRYNRKIRIWQWFALLFPALWFTLKAIFQFIYLISDIGINLLKLTARSCER